MKRIVALVAGLILALSLTACGTTSSLSADIDDDARGVDVVAQDAKAGSAVTGNVTVAKGECLVIASALEKGRFEVRVKPMEQENSEPDDGFAANETIDGSFITVCDLEPGEYVLDISVKDNVENNTTGKLMLLPYPADEIDLQSGDVPDALLKTLGML